MFDGRAPVLYLAVILLIGGFLIGAYKRSSQKALAVAEAAEPRMRSNSDIRTLKSNIKAAKWTSITMLIIGVIFGLISIIRIVPANSVGIPVTFGSIGESMNSGFKITSP